MGNRSSSNSVVVVLFLVMLLAAVGGGGYYYAIVRPQQEMAMLAVAQAQMARAQAAVEANEARKQVTPVATGAPAEAPATSTIDEPAIRAAVESVLRTQEAAWNRGDIDTFVDHYWKSDDLTFSSEGKTTRGWNATLKRYRERYGTRDKMGRLSFGGLEITPLGDSAALVLGEWKLERDREPVGGNFSLVMRKIDDRWVIVHDHTSRLVEPK